MVNILCYGDSNTYGYNPKNGERYPMDVRWTGVLQRLLGDGYNIIEEGCNGRTTKHNYGPVTWKNGLDYLRPCLNSHKPIDMVIMMLGSNDLKHFFHETAESVAKSAGELVDLVCDFCQEHQGFKPKVVLVSPPQIGEDVDKLPFKLEFRRGAHFESMNFSKYFKKEAKRRDCIYFDAAEHVVPSEADCLHLDPEAHEILAHEFARIVREKL